MTPSAWSALVAAPDLGAAGQHEALVGAVAAQAFQAPADELVDIAMVVGEQNPVLHVAPVAARVVHEAAQRVVDAHGIEERERARLAFGDIPLAVGHLVPHER